jgi:hypothetical protein
MAGAAITRWTCCCCSCSVAPLFDLLIENADDIEVMPLFAESSKQALETGRDMFPGQRVAVVLQQSEPGGEVE